MFERPFLAVCIVLSLSQKCMGIPPGDGWFYSSHGYYNNSCKVSQCETNCNTGLYRAGCSGNSTGGCVACTNGPEFSSYSTRGNLISDCTWSCNAGYIKTNNICVENTACTKTIPSFSTYSNTNYPNCDHQCNAGYFGAVETNPVSCSACQAGKYSLNGKTVCTDCVAGTFSINSASPSDVSCEKCPAGTFSANAGESVSAACKACPGGAYSIAQGSVDCQVCPEGTSSALTRANSAEVCSPCTPGKYTNTTGRIVCDTCGAGTFSQTGATKCSNCAPDTYASSPGLGVCLPCAICNTPGIYRSGCGAVSAGVCTSCVNPAV